MLKTLRACFDEAGYTVDGVRELLGPVAGAALARDQVVPALRVVREDPSTLAALTALLWIQEPVPVSAALPVAELVGTGLARREGDLLVPLLHVEPLDWPGQTRYAVSDLKVRPGDAPGSLAADHVVGVGGASYNLARLVVHRAVDSALDLGTGSGVQALLLADRARRITATDTNPRALELTRLSLDLSGMNAELRQGSLFQPVPERYDLIVSNPPFVISPDGRFPYRESGMAGDDVCRRLVQQAPNHLTEGGWCQLLANWLHIDGEPWDERVADWISGCDAWVVQRDVQDPAEYAELWLRDSCEAGSAEYRERYDAWLAYFERERVTGIGFGWISLREGGGSIKVEELRHAVDQPVGAYVESVLDGFVAADHPFTRLRTADGVVSEQIGRPGAEDPERIVLRQTSGLRRATGVGTTEAALAGVCDGSLPLEPLLGAIAQLTDTDEDAVRAHADAVLPELVADGFFEVTG
ncbi:class I SAM-dependent methyltransferase [Actinocorallia sp. A-T 12471]|uniref:class I SAM-dependent methyltransferase n=1 Tax=Actinocorallia sp. A-T 12471 TaxID=3089813 RepID=UPI0029CC79DE|nr:class I SAM-dependent methyltransferase [Actinocorallia sp. A-T 12471]MDX6741882.1 class I SAM-dependent methyltransferase [Actinocorallia sp. A-T 12471]